MNGADTNSQSNISMSFQDSWWVTWWDGDTFHTRRFLIKGEEAWTECEISYRSVQSEEAYDPFDDIAYRAMTGIVFNVFVQAH